MRSLYRFSLLAVCATGLFACGGGAKIAPTKEGAASAAFAAGRGGGSTHSTMRAVLQPVTGLVSATATARCPNGGTVKVTTHIDTSGTSTALTLEVIYDDCNYDGESSMRGTVNMVMSSVIDGQSVATAMTMTGRVEFSGAISDYVVMDLTQTVDVSKISATTGSVQLVLDGTVTTSSGTYSYDQETIVVTADTIEAASS